MCCGLFAALSRSSSMPAYLPCLGGANSTEIVQVPPFAAIVWQVLALTLNGGVAAGAVVSETGAGLSLTTVMLWEELTASADTGPKLSDFGRVFIFAARPLPLSLTIRIPDRALLFNCSCPVCLPAEVGTEAISSVQDAPGCNRAGQLFDITANPLLTFGCHKVTGVKE